jgi:RNA polymerase sigma factor (sigma-70 family)
MAPRTAQTSLTALVSTAVNGDPEAWRLLVTRFAPVVRAAARRHRLSDFDADEVAQRTWLALFQNLSRLNEPEALGAWVSTTARRECLRLLRQSSRELPMAEPPVGASNGETEDEDERIVAERSAALRRALARVPEHQRVLLNALTADPAPSYEQVSRKLGIPVGSIGPTRLRCVARLRRDPHIATLIDDVAPPLRTTRPSRFGDHDLA